MGIKGLSGSQNGHGGQKGSRSEPVDAKIARIAAEQLGLITLAQLYARGLTYTEVRRRVEKGRLFPLHCGVYAVGRPDVSPRGHLKAGLLALGDAAFLSHDASLAFQGLRRIDTRHIHVTVIADHTPKRPGLIVHRTAAPHRSEIRDRFGFRYSSLARALIEIAPDESPEELGRIVTEGIRKGLVDFTAIRETLDRHEHRPGVRIVRRALARYLDPTDRKSELERSFDSVISGDSRFPAYERNVRAGPYEWDVVFRAQRLVVELDGRPYHSTMKDMDNDRAKDTWVQRQGMRFMRITDFMWDHARTEMIEDLLGLLAQGGWIPGQQTRAA